MSTQPRPHHSYRSTLFTYVALLLLAAWSVLLTVLHLGQVNLWAPLAIGVVQAALVVLFFMHMSQESRLWKTLFLSVLAILAIFIGLTYVDVLFR